MFQPPAEGSGIRALTYDPDGVDGPLKAPPAGNIYMFAPKGVIDAGEAGIAGRNVILGAVQVLNANNIIFSGTSVGVPSSSNMSGLGALTGMGNVAQDMKSQEAAVMNATTGKFAQAASIGDSISGLWVDVKVVSFDVDPDDPSLKEDN